jgi:hypothetical protein
MLPHSQAAHHKFTTTGALLEVAPKPWIVDLVPDMVGAMVSVTCRVVVQMLVQVAPANGTQHMCQYQRVACTL